MKNKLFIALGLVLALTTQKLIAQEIIYSTHGNIVVIEGGTVIDGFEAPAFIVYFENEVPKLEDAWKDYLKDFYNIKQRKSRGFLKAEDISLPEISSKPITLYTQIDAERPMPKFLVSAAISRDSFIETINYPVETSNVKSMIIKFIKSHQLNLVNEELADVQKVYNEMNDDLSKIEKDKASEMKDKLKSEGTLVKLNGDIEKDKQKILDLQAEINSLEQEIRKEEASIMQYEAAMKDLQKNIDEQAETLKIQKDKIDKIRAKKDLIISQSSISK